MLSVCLVCIFSTAHLQAGGDHDIDHRNSRISPTSAGNVPSSPPIISVHVFMTKESHAVVHLLTCVRIFVSPWTAVLQASLSITNSWNLLKLLSIKSVMPSNHVILCHPLLLLPSVFPSIRVFSNESVLRIGWPKYWSFSFNISPSSEPPGLIFL